MQKTLLILLLLTYYGKIANGQSPIDSLENIFLKNLKMDRSIKKDSLVTVSLLDYLRINANNNPEKVKSYIDSVSNYLKTSKWQEAEAYNNLLQGSYYLQLDWKKRAFEFFEKASVLFKKSNDKKMALYSDQRIMTLLSYELLFEEPMTQPRFEHFEQFLLENLKEIKVDGDTIMLANQNLGLGLFYLRNKKFDKSLQYYKAASDIVATNPDKHFFYYYSGIWAQGLSLIHLGKTEEGFKLINYIKEVCKKPRNDGQNVYISAIMSVFLSEYYLINKNYENAISEAMAGYELPAVKRLKLLRYLLDKNLYYAHNELNHYKEALIYYRNFQDYLKEEKNKDFNAQYSEYQLKYDDEKRLATIKTLEIKQLKSESEKNNLIRNVLLMSLLAGIGLVFYVYNNNRKLQTKNDQLVSKNKEIEGALLKGQTIERKRVAEELHDNLSAKIAAVRWRMESLEPTFDNEIDTDFYKNTSLALGEIYTDVRLIAHNLLPAVLEQKGLIAAIKALVSEINGLNKTKFSADLPEQETRFANKIEYELYSILLELSNNILKHSEAKNAKISLANNTDSVQLIVADDGIGISKPIQSNGMGFGNLKSRVESINGKLKVNSKNGLEIAVEVPI